MNPSTGELPNLRVSESAGESLPGPRTGARASRVEPGEYLKNKTVASVFEEIAAAHADAIAVTFDGRSCSYRELNRKANRLARRLRRSGVGAETKVACCVPRSFELIVALLGILKSGGAYVPLDPANPRERTQFLLKDTGAPLLVTRRSLQSSFAEYGVATLCVDELDEDEGDRAEDGNPPAVGGPTSLAYVMYTSGSTGTPKGVMVEQRGILRLVRGASYCEFGADEVFLQFAPVAFDASTFEIWGALLNGGRLVVMPSDATSLEELGRTIREQGVTTLWLTSGVFHLMVEQRLEDLRCVRQLLAGGDVLSPRHVRMALEGLPGCVVINGYGPTENTTFTCCHRMTSREEVTESVPIGRPISHTHVHILDERMQSVAVGAVGELYTSGDGVARGYLNDAEMTAEKFLVNPFSETPGERLYRTGDLARRRDDGVIEFCGRADSQVKILGHRVEPGEIEVALRGFAGVKQACVVARTDERGAKQLLGYFVPTSQPTITGKELRSFLSDKLPPYMIPTHFIAIDSLPLTANGKVDRGELEKRALPSAEDKPAEAAVAGLEETIVTVWKEALQIKQAGMDDNFFDLGGDSLLLVAVHAKLEKRLSIKVPVMDLFEFTTVRKLARHLTERRALESQTTEAQTLGQKQRDTFARFRERRAGGGS